MATRALKPCEAAAPDSAVEEGAEALQVLAYDSVEHGAGRLSAPPSTRCAVGRRGKYREALESRRENLEKEFAFPDFKTALAFTNRVGALAESEGHHPDILLAWGKVRITIWTHKIDGLTESDFILAAKAEQLPR